MEKGSFLCIRVQLALMVTVSVYTSYKGTSYHLKFLQYLETLKLVLSLTLGTEPFFKLPVYKDIKIQKDC